jgi:hypothetical protein
MSSGTVASTTSVSFHLRTHAHNETRARTHTQRCSLYTPVVECNAAMQRVSTITQTRHTQTQTHRHTDTHAKHTYASPNVAVAMFCTVTPSGTPKMF